MPRPPKKPDKDWRTGSALIARPDHVHALGMISIEVAGMETMLGSLLGALLHIAPQIGRLIYLTPRAALGRIAILEHVLNVALKEGGRTRTDIEKNLGKAKAILGKRHKLVHGHWGLSDLSKHAEVSVHDLPYLPRKPPRAVPLSELTDLVETIRTTTENVRTITESLYAEWPPYTSRPKRRKHRASSKRSSIK
jgi:hypothetical protein